MRPRRAWTEIIDDWGPQLAAKLERPEKEIRDEGLMAYDFDTGASVEVRYRRGPKHRFKYAFALIRPEASLAAVFTEHDGYIEFDLEEDCEIIQTLKTYYVHEA